MEKYLIAAMTMETRWEIARATIVSEPLALSDKYRVFLPSQNGHFSPCPILRHTFAGTKRRSM